MPPFKTCPSCSQIWQTRDEFVLDTQLELNGYKADFEKLEYGLFFFTHHQNGCFSTMAIEVLDFKDMFSGKPYPERKTDSEECPGYCRDKEQLERCDNICECAFVREIMNMLRDKDLGKK
jgi:hypothetical protein